MNRLLASLSTAALLCAAASGQVANGYLFTQSLGGPYVPITGGTLISTATTANTMDDVSYPVTTPFGFVFDNNSYTAIVVQTNGHLSFSAATPGTTYAPLSSTLVVPGYIAACAADLQGGYVSTSTRTLGSDQVTVASSIGPMQVGDVITGTGIPAATTILAIVGNVITMSALATATSTSAMTAYGPWSEMRYETQGVSPNQVFIVQWSNFRRYSTGSPGLYLNFQIRLYETTNVIEAVYGDCSPGTSTSTGLFQVGLRGPNNTFATSVNNRLNVKGTSDWATSTAGTVNSSGEVFNNVAPANVIPNGLIYNWTPQLIASNVNSGTGCGAQYASFYQSFANMAAAAPALSNTAIQLTNTGSGYIVTNSAATIVPPSGTATVLALTDDSQAAVVLSNAMPVAGGTTTGLMVCSNAFVSVATGNGTAFNPVVATLLAMPQTVFSSWHDLNPGLVGSGQVKFEEVGTTAYVTYDGVWDFGGTSVADASTIQFVFDEISGNVTIVWGTLSPNGTSGVGLLAGYSPGGASLDPGSITLATGLPLVLTAADVPPLALSAAPVPVLGNTVVYTTSNIPLTAAISAQLVSLGVLNPGIAIPGAPGCFQYVDLSLAATVLLFGSPTATFSLSIPNDAGLIGLPLGNQSASLVPGVNPLQVITSNVVKSTVSNI